jgi:ribosomal protein S6--L-glutamate ligase
VRDKRDVLPAIERVGGAPVIIKLLEGTQGIGVLLAETTKNAEAIIELLQSQKQNVLIQKFVAESKGRDIRAFVVGDEVVGAMRRIARGQEFRSNVHRGGMTERVQLDDEYRETAVRAAQIMGLRIAGVDLLEGKDGPQIVEVNSSPGLEGIEGCTQLDIAGAIVDYIAAQVDFPEIDLRQRLTVSRGYGVTEIHIPAGSGYVGRSIRESGLRDKDINVLTLFRGAAVIPNPKSERQLEAGDRLLCFGKLDLMRDLVPSRTQRARQDVRQLDPESAPPAARAVPAAAAAADRPAAPPPRPVRPATEPVPAAAAAAVAARASGLPQDVDAGADATRPAYDEEE